ncbi:Temperature-induced lipocalin-1 [Holothuria leucospilota]|uniref:Temperature-induced lipocalin-1 n=1 Tax=Holothuria leucospilota TaxID=206669 RepID=A0A9Q1C3U7_HOLLE|nr:Temperature-induced lipocalin-1 [Holothuria leucospilota]
MGSFLFKLCFLGFVGSVISFPLSVDLSPPETVKQLDVSAYLGRWYQVYADFIVFSTFERNAQCVTADYGLKSDFTISVLNTNTDGSPTGNFNMITGDAYTPNPKEPGQLKVQLDGVPVAGDYWIIQLGPMEGNPPQYQYSVVTDRDRFTLFVLARNVSDFQTRFEKDVLQFLNDDGFDRFYNKPQLTVQVKECKYVTPPAV